MALRSPPGLQKRPAFEPQCTHLTMTRLYSPELLCASCHRPGPFGWLYQCTQDRDDSLEHAATRGDLSNMDQLGCFLTSKMGIRQGSPAAREDPLSFFNEVTQEQMAHYKPDQIAKILKQRENVQLVIQREKIRMNSAAILNRLTHPSAVEAPPCHHDFQKPWLRSPHEECQYRVCFRCRSSCADRAYLSLNAVAKGEILPTAAAGYGFHILGDRPVLDANVVMNLGCRPVPWPQSESVISDISSEMGSPTSSISVMELLDAQIAQGQKQIMKKCDSTDGTETDSDDDLNWPATPTTLDGSPGQLKHSPRCDNLGLFAETAPITCAGPMAPLFWTPPPSPVVATGLHEGDGTFEPQLLGPETLKGLSETPSKIGSLNHNAGHMREASIDETIEATPNTIRASHTPSPKRDHKFAPSPLKVGHGVAMLEESVELGVPDVITQA
ncbi:hypothetical protein PT974_05061 [Cladobotryum mycophilum]|uniref:Uncharacterized protein n=1 Tax=Cladobotryum mycophilum TaxID=491253 RepID=A0ABR0SQX9_9HYPO